MTAQLPSRERLSDDLLGQIAFYAGEAICHPDPNYALEYQNLAYPANVLALVNEVIASRALLAAHEQEPVSFDALRNAVAEMTGGRPMEWMNGDSKGHQVVPFINFNSLSRIVEKFRTHPAPSIPAAVPDYFAGLVSAARVRADKAMLKFPQPNYVLNKVAEESGEVIKAVIHYTEGREEWANVEGELIDNLAMLIRLVTEGDQVIGFTPPESCRAAAPKGV